MPLVLLCCLSTGALGRELVITDEARQVPDQELRVLSDHSFTVEQVLEAPSRLWNPAQKMGINRGTGRGAHWLQLTLRNPKQTPIERILVSDYPAANDITLFLVDQKGLISQRIGRVGIDFPFSDREESHRRALATLRLAPGETITALWRVESHPLFRFRTALWKPEAFQRQDSNRTLLFGMLYGALMIMAVYNLFLWLSLREKHYLFYVLYLLCIGYAIAADEGHVYQYLAPTSDWPKTTILTLVNCVAVVSFFIFSSSFLRLRRRQQTLYRWLRGLGLFNIALLILGGVFDQVWAIRSALITILPFYCVALLAGIRLRMQGFMPAGYYVIAILLLVIGVGLNNLTILGVLPGADSIESYTAIGTVLMMAFLSLALANKINQLQKDSDVAGEGIANANREIHRINAELLRVRNDWATLESAVVAARQESQAKSEFLATLGHEIRTPMSGLLGMAQLLKKTDLDTNQLHYVAAIERSGRALLDVITDLMDYTIVETGMMELDIEPFDLETLIDDSLSVFTLHAVEKNISLFAELDAEIPPSLRGDRRKLQQIVLNLLSNAFKFTASGEILLRITRTGRTAVNSLELKFEVLDTGIGLSEQIQAELFNPFSGDKGAQALASRQLGLAICRQLVDLMDGDIGVESSPGRGATFWFTARFLAAPNQPERPKPLDAHRVLLLVPPGFTSDALERVLTSWGAAVDRASNRDEAGALLASQHHDLLLVEHDIGGTSGVRLLRDLSADYALPPSILLTGAANARVDESPSSAGVALVLEKPITLQPLRETLLRGMGLANGTGRDAAALNPTACDFGLLRVLVVEDNPVNRLVIIGLLRQLSVEPVVVHSGFEALDLVQRTTFDAILVDCEMPELDGYETARQIRGTEERDSRKPARIVAVSAHAGSDYRDKALDAGMDAYLSKPVALRDLAHELTSAGISQPPD